MQVQMRVHNVSTHPAEVDVVYNGENLRAVVPELHVELMHLDGQHGSIALRYRSKADIDEAKAMFVQGGTVTMTFAQGEAPPAAVDTSATETPAS